MIKSNGLSILLYAAKEPKHLSASILAEKFGLREEAISSSIKELELEGLLTVKKFVQGMSLSLSARGRLMLINLKGEIAIALGDESVLCGVVERGKGEGKYCVSTPGYKEPLSELLGGTLYEGTLNLEVDSLLREKFLSSMEAVLVEGSEGSHSYGTAKFYTVKINGRRCGLLVGTSKQYPTTKVEIIDTVHLRSALQLRDGDVVMVERF